MILVRIMTSVVQKKYNDIMNYVLGVKLKWA